MPTYAKPYKSSYIELSDVRIAISEWGATDGIVILALHGWLDNMASYYPLIGDGRWLEDLGIRLIAVDLAGHGYSGHRQSADGYPFYEYVIDLHNLIYNLDLDDFVLLGHSMGGAIASIYSGTEVANNKGLILIESLGPLTHEESNAPEQLLKHLNYRIKSRDKPVRKVYKTLKPIISVRASRSDISHEAAKLLLLRNMQETDEGYIWRSDPRLNMPSTMYLSNKQVNAFISNIQCKTLLIYADDGPIQDYPVIEGRVDLLEKVQMQALSGGHHLHMTEPDNVRKVIINYLKTIQ